MVRFFTSALPRPSPGPRQGSATVARLRLQAAIVRDRPATRSGAPTAAALLDALLAEHLPESARRRS